MYADSRKATYFRGKTNGRGFRSLIQDDHACMPCCMPCVPFLNQNKCTHSETDPLSRLVIIIFSISKVHYSHSAMTRFTALAVALVLATDPTSAFTPPAAPSRPSLNPSITAAHLVPEEGRQLVAFSQVYLAKQAKASAGKASNLTSTRRPGVAAAARGLMARLLNHDETEIEAMAHQHHEAEVMYPLVGFDLVDGHAVPTPGQRAACRLHLSEAGRREEPYGCWSGEGGGNWS